MGCLYCGDLDLMPGSNFCMLEHEEKWNRNRRAEKERREEERELWEDNRR